MIVNAIPRDNKPSEITRLRYSTIHKINVNRIPRDIWGSFGIQMRLGGTNIVRMVIQFVFVEAFNMHQSQTEHRWRIAWRSDLSYKWQHSFNRQRTCIEMAAMDAICMTSHISAWQLMLHRTLCDWEYYQGDPSGDVIFCSLQFPGRVLEPGDMGVGGAIDGMTSSWRGVPLGQWPPCGLLRPQRLISVYGEATAMASWNQRRTWPPMVMMGLQFTRGTKQLGNWPWHDIDLTGGLHNNICLTDKYLAYWTDEGAVSQGALHGIQNSASPRFWCCAIVIFWGHRCWRCWMSWEMLECIKLEQSLFDWWHLSH